MTVMAFPEIPRGVLARLLDMVGEPGVMSPRRLMGEPDRLGTLQIAELYGAEYLSRPAVATDALSPTFARAARVILDPVTHLTFRMWGADDMCAEASIVFPGDVVAGGGVALTPLDLYYRLAAFVEPDDIVADLKPVLPPDDEGRPKPFDFDAHLDASVAIVLFALADLERGRGLDVGESGFSEIDISGYIEGRWGMTGFDSLVSYAEATGMLSKPPSPLEVEVAVSTLTQAGALVVRKTTPNRYALAPAMRPLVDLTKDLSSGLQWQRVTLLESGDTLVVNRIYLYGEDGLTLCLAPTTQARMLVASVARRDVLTFVVDEITGVAGASSRVSDAAPATQEALPETPAWTACPNCDADLDGDQAFCVSCGARIQSAEPEPEPEPKARFCTECGARIEGDSRFCTECGATVEA